MVVEKRAANRAAAPGRPSGDSGQSILEFVLMLPVMVSLVVLVVKVNSAIQVGIVNQQYARAHAFTMAGNSSVYPWIRLRGSQLDEKGMNQLVVGISDQPVDDGGEPIATMQSIARRAPAAVGNPKEEPDKRDLLRIRGTVTLCTQTNVLNKKTPILALDGNSRPSAKNALNEASRFDYCDPGPSLRYNP